MLKAPTCWGRLSQVLIKGSAKADLLLQSMADPGNAAETLTNVLAGAGKTFSESPGAAPAQNNAPQLQSTGNLGADLANLEGGERK
ncbi:hypothetical protein AtubIFM55763_007873 [Aspergillus tubingensis]|uniref:Uncharacterized protein n=1 Tax=Aspergillus tubingensis TaxID=5068 RepID=A0A9W6EPJ7_ASPTU|nr:hypothetical protein AtubIFM54640_002149 [Aspergillus tubingensis]GLA76303.1 hypothetical protein AtubIFM55763_007873 [Aspergillus tubingensis]GLA87074.1 hypothetical protein AtubIFM56815_011347 [Aspergillus tubingensis]